MNNVLQTDQRNGEDLITDFLSGYDGPTALLVRQLRQVLLTALPGCTEQIDRPARLIVYTYGQHYATLVCVIILSRKGLKLGFNRGIELPDPDGLLADDSRLSRYILIREPAQLHMDALHLLLAAALQLAQQQAALVSDPALPIRSENIL